MTLLAFDTCLGAVSVAVHVGGRTHEDFALCDSGHAERLFPMIDAVMNTAGVRFSDLTRLAVTLGPGGFTGLRVGIAAARGIALAAGLPTIGISSLELMALEINAEDAADATKLVVAVDARKGSLFVQEFSVGPIRTLGSARLMDVEDAAHDVADAVIVGSGAAILAAMAPSGRRPLRVLTNHQPRAALLVAYAQHLTRCDELRPIYLRAADAKPQTGKALPRA
jgi:tRNA threonylcarbamoyladenosine biosynthesis protein TsaB